MEWEFGGVFVEVFGKEMLGLADMKLRKILIKFILFQNMKMSPKLQMLSPGLEQ